jgi:hypothetical protein
MVMTVRLDEEIPENIVPVVPYDPERRAFEFIPRQIIMMGLSITNLPSLISSQVQPWLLHYFSVPQNRCILAVPFR